MVGENVSNGTKQFIPLVYGTYMASVDVFMLGLLKAINLGWINKAYIFLPTVIYAMQPWVFLSSLKYESMTIMNLMWDVLSDLFVTLSGIYFFKEKISKTQMLGVFFAIIAVILLSSDHLAEKK